MALKESRKQSTSNQRITNPWGSRADRKATISSLRKQPKHSDIVAFDLVVLKFIRCHLLFLFGWMPDTNKFGATGTNDFTIPL